MHFYEKITIRQYLIDVLNSLDTLYYHYCILNFFRCHNMYLSLKNFMYQKRVLPRQNWYTTEFAIFGLMSCLCMFPFDIMYQWYEQVKRKRMWYFSSCSSLTTLKDLLLYSSNGKIFMLYIFRLWGYWIWVHKRVNVECIIALELTYHILKVFIFISEINLVYTIF